MIVFIVNSMESTKATRIRKKFSKVQHHISGSIIFLYVSHVRLENKLKKIPKAKKKEIFIDKCLKIRAELQRQ